MITFPYEMAWFTRLCTLISRKSHYNVHPYQRRMTRARPPLIHSCLWLCKGKIKISCWKFRFFNFISIILQDFFLLKTVKYVKVPGKILNLRIYTKVKYFYYKFMFANIFWISLLLFFCSSSKKTSCSHIRRIWYLKILPTITALEYLPITFRKRCRLSNTLGLFVNTNVRVDSS